LSFRENHASIKKQIKAKYQQAGVVCTVGTKLFNPTQRDHYLRQLPSKTRQQIVENLYASLDATGALRNKARAAMVKLGRRYPEISQFQRMPSVSVVGAHVFGAFIQNPHRFATKQRLWRYCRLGVVERSSAGKPLAYKRLDRSGRGPLKAVSHQCYMSALRTKESNEVSRFYEACLWRTGNPLHARLKTQRKYWSYFGGSGRIM
jgi:transposase